MNVRHHYRSSLQIAAVMLLASFLLLFVINGLQRWSEARTGRRV